MRPFESFWPLRRSVVQALILAQAQAVKVKVQGDMLQLLGSYFFCFPVQSSSHFNWLNGRLYLFCFFYNIFTHTYKPFTLVQSKSKCIYFRTYSFVFTTVIELELKRRIFSNYQLHKRKNINHDLRTLDNFSAYNEMPMTIRQIERPPKDVLDKRIRAHRLTHVACSLHVIIYRLKSVNKHHSPPFRFIA